MDTAAVTDDEHWMEQAPAQARDAYTRGDWPTGAVLVRDGRMLGTGPNRQVSRADVTCHAEPGVIRRALAGHGPRSTEGATLYRTMEPCPMCAGALKLAGVARVVLALRHATLCRTDLGAYTFEVFCTLTGYAPALTDGMLQDRYPALRRAWGGDTVAPGRPQAGRRGRTPAEGASGGAPPPDRQPLALRVPRDPSGDGWGWSGIGGHGDDGDRRTATGAGTRPISRTVPSRGPACTRSVPTG